MTYMVVTPDEVLAYLQLNEPGSTSQYDAGTVGSNILAAQDILEQRTQRYWLDRSDFAWTQTSMLRAQVPIPGLRTATTVVWGTEITPESYWLIPDAQQTGLFAAIQFRAYRADQSVPYWYADQLWWDKLLDNPFYPGNYGGGYAYTSMPNDLVITGDWGYENGAEPYYFRHAVKVLSAFYTIRPNSLLADVAITPQGGVVNYSQMPPEVGDFIRVYSFATQTAVTSVG